MELDQLGEPPGPEPEWSGEWDRRSTGLVNDRAYGDEDGLWERALGSLPEDCAHLYLARVDGAPASFVMVHDHEGDCVFGFAATLPAWAAGVRAHRLSRPPAGAHVRAPPVLSYATA